MVPSFECHSSPNLGIHVQTRGVRWTLGCVNPASWLPLALAMWREFTQLRAHLITSSVCGYNVRASWHISCNNTFTYCPLLCFLVVGQDGHKRKSTERPSITTSDLWDRTKRFLCARSSRQVDALQFTQLPEIWRSHHVVSDRCCVSVSVVIRYD